MPYEICEKRYIILMLKYILEVFTDGLLTFSLYHTINHKKIVKAKKKKSVFFMFWGVNCCINQFMNDGFCKNTSFQIFFGGLKYVNEALPYEICALH